MKEDRQQALLLAQLNKKRELKQKYLHQPKEADQQEKTGAPQSTALGELVMTNAMLLAIRARKDIFGAINRFRSEARQPAFSGTLFDTVLNWCAELAETADCSVYELFIDDRPKRRKIVHNLLENLKRDCCDGWEEIRIDPSGSASFVLPHFDYYYRMTEQPSAEVSLVFQRTAAPDGSFRYGLMIGDLSRKGPDDLIPDHAVLWEERAGDLKEFTEAVIADLEGGWVLLKEDFAHRRECLRKEAAKLKDLCAVLEEQPEGLNFKALLQKEKQLLEKLCEEERAAYDRMPAALKKGHRGENVQNCLILLGGVTKSMDRAILSLSAPAQAPLADILSEAVYLLENAGEPM